MSASSLQPLFSRPISRTGMSLATRIILINAVAMLLMVAGLIYFGQYLDRLVANEVSLLMRQTQLVANKLGSEALSNGELDVQSTRDVVQRLTEGIDIRAAVYDIRGHILVDSRTANPTQTNGTTTAGAPGNADKGTINRLIDLFDWVAMLVPYGNDLPAYEPLAYLVADNQPDVRSAMLGKTHWSLWLDTKKNLIITVAIPVMQGNKVAGVTFITRDSEEIAATLRSLRVELLQIFGLMLGISMVISLYMAQTIASPLRRLANAARGAQAIAGGLPDIPDYHKRGDEIGELSVALQAMTKALWDRLDAIERFAADVAHEVKNPLTSMKSALETLARVKDDSQRDRLIAILSEDVTRLQRLITDISGASRLEAELSRTTPELFDLSAVLTNLITSKTNSGAPLSFHVSSTGLMVRGIPGRLIQVAENLIANALSFSPEGKPVTLRLSGAPHEIRFTVEDSGPGIAPGKEEKIFERFYSERPEGESFGTHSGLGLSICRQIVEGHGGKIIAENRKDDAGKVLGARFIVTLPRQLG